MRTGWVFGLLSERHESDDICVFAQQDTFILPHGAAQPVLSEVLILTPTELEARERKAWEAGKYGLQDDDFEFYLKSEDYGK